MMSNLLAHATLPSGSGSSTVEWTLGLAFVLGLLHALEPGHGKTAMWVYLSSGGRRPWHPLVMGASTAFSHSISLLLIALTVHAAHHVITCDHTHEHPVSYGLQVASTGLIFVIGLWMLWAACRGKATTCGCAQHRGATAEASSLPTDASRQSTSSQGLVQLSRSSPAAAPQTTTVASAGNADGTSPPTPQPAGVGLIEPKSDNYRTTALLGIAIGLLPCPSALAAYLTSLSAGQPATAYWTILLFSLGIGVSLTCVGWGLQWLGAGLGRRLHRWQHLPWAHLRAALILMVAVFYATRL
jgi:nickel/cobalt transporter (NicO) family protein